VDAVTTDRYLAMALDTTIVQGHGGPRTCEDRTRDAAALRRRLDPVGLHLRWPATTSTCLSRSSSRKDHCDEP